MYKFKPSKNYLYKTHGLFKALVPYKTWEYSCSIVIYDNKTKHYESLNSKPSQHKKASISIETFLEYLNKKSHVLFREPFATLDPSVLELIVFKTLLDLTCQLFSDKENEETTI